MLGSKVLRSPARINALSRFAGKVNGCRQKHIAVRRLLVYAPAEGLTGGYGAARTESYRALSTGKEIR